MSRNQVLLSLFASILGRLAQSNYILLKLQPFSNFFFFRLLRQGSPYSAFSISINFVPIFCIILRHFNLSHVLSYCIPIPSFRPSPFPLSWHFRPQQPYPNIPIFFPPYMSEPGMQNAPTKCFGGIFMHVGRFLELAIFINLIILHRRSHNKEIHKLLIKYLKIVHKMAPHAYQNSMFLFIPHYDGTAY